MGVLAVAGQKLTASFLNQYYTFADTSTTTVTQATQNPITSSYSIPANEPAVGSSYTIAFGGNGTWGSTQQTLAFTVVVGSTATLSGSIVVGATAFAASAAFRFVGHARIVWNTVGATGNFTVTLLLNISESANALQVPATVNQANLEAANSIGFGDASTGVSGATDTTVSNAYVVKCAWGATTGAPTLTNRQTIWSKVS